MSPGAVLSFILRCAAVRGRPPMRAAGAHVWASGSQAAARPPPAAAGAPPAAGFGPPPAPRGKAYLPFQLEAISFILARRRVIVADEMGLGKTVTSIGALNVLEASAGLKRVLVIAPKSLVLTWEAELQSWLAAPFQILVGLARVDDPSELEERAVVVLNYEMVGKHKPLLSAVDWDMLICDEAHLLKNPKTQRTIAILGQLIPDGRKASAPDAKPETGPIDAPYKLFLTGSPLLNRPIELFPLVAAVDPAAQLVPAVSSYRAFAERYCDARLVGIPGKPHRKRWDLTGASNEPELRELLGKVMLRRLKKDVLSNLPPKLFQLLPLENRAVRSAEDRALLEIVQQATEAAAEQPDAPAFGVAPADGAPADDIAALSWVGLARAMTGRSDALRQATSSLPSERIIPVQALSRIMAARRQTALQKVPAALEHISRLIDGDDDDGGAEAGGAAGGGEGGRKLVVFAHHTDVIAELVAGLGERAVQLTGADTAEARKRAVSRFQTDPEVRVFVGSILAAGVGITLTAASHVLFVELDWSPAFMAQAEDRCHRIGQSSSVLISYLVFRGTLDERLAQMLIEKQDTINRCLPINAPEGAINPINAGPEDAIDASEDAIDRGLPHSAPPGAEPQAGAEAEGAQEAQAVAEAEADVAAAQAAEAEFARAQAEEIMLAAEAQAAQAAQAETQAQAARAAAQAAAQAAQAEVAQAAQADEASLLAEHEGGAPSLEGEQLLAGALPAGPPGAGEEPAEAAEARAAGLLADGGGQAGHSLQVAEAEDSGLAGRARAQLDAALESTAEAIARAQAALPAALSAPEDAAPAAEGSAGAGQAQGRRRAGSARGAAAAEVVASADAPARGRRRAGAAAEAGADAGSQLARVAAADRLLDAEIARLSKLRERAAAELSSLMRTQEELRAASLRAIGPEPAATEDELAPSALPRPPSALARRRAKAVSDAVELIAKLKERRLDDADD